MSKLTCFNKIYQFSPEILNRNIEDQITASIRKNVKKCSEEGYILNIQKIQIGDANISPSSSMIDIDVKIWCKRLLPKRGDIYAGKICLIFELGILLQVAQVLKVLVPLENCRFEGLEGEWTMDSGYDDEGGLREKQMRSNHGTTFSMGELKKIKIELAHYNPVNKGFNCYGSFVRDEN